VSCRIYLDSFKWALKLDHPLLSNILIKSVYAVKTEINILSTELEIQNNNGCHVDELPYRKFITD
jgi:hypothetical protein